MNKWIVLPALLLTGAIGFFGWKELGKPKPTLRQESKTERDASIRAAFTPSVGSGDTSHATENTALMAEAQMFLDELGEAFTSADPENLHRLISFESMFWFTEKSGLIDLGNKSPIEATKWRNGFLRGMKNGIANNAEKYAYTRGKILRLEQLRDGELIVYSRVNYTSQDGDAKIRWWLLRNAEGQWQTYDWESLDAGIRTSTLMGVIADPGDQNVWFRDLKRCLASYNAYFAQPDDDRFSSFADSSEKLLEYELPATLESLGRMLRIKVLVGHGADPEEALGELDKLEKLSGATPTTIYLRGESLHLLGQYQKAMTQYLKYTEILGWDSDIHAMLGDCHRNLDQLPECLEHAEKGLADYDQSLECLSLVAVSLPADRHDELLRYHAKFNDKESAYEAILDGAIGSENADVYNWIFPKLKADFPASELIDWYEREDPFGKKSE